MHRGIVIAHPHPLRPHPARSGLARGATRDRPNQKLSCLARKWRFALMLRRRLVRAVWRERGCENRCPICTCNRRPHRALPARARPCSVPLPETASQSSARTHILAGARRRAYKIPEKQPRQGATSGRKLCRKSNHNWPTAPPNVTFASGRTRGSLLPHLANPPAHVSSSVRGTTWTSQGLATDYAEIRNC